MIPLAHAKAERLHIASDLAAAHDQTEERNGEEAQPKSDAFCDAYSLMNLFFDLDSPGYCALDQQWDASWCKLEREEKLSIVKARCERTSSDAKELYDEIADGREDKWEALVEGEDSFVQKRKNKKYI